MELEPPNAEPPKRHHFQFSLRTLMIVVTLLCVVGGYVGWQAKKVNERKTLLERVVSDGGGYFRVSLGPRDHEEYSVCGAIPGNGKWLVPSHEYPPPSWIRRWLGDDRICTIWLPKSFSATDLAIIAEGFPEAGVGQGDEQDK
jgi:hypothetical protein